MNFIRKIFTDCNKSQALCIWYQQRLIHTSNIIYVSKEVSSEKDEDKAFDILQELRPPDLTEEEILQKRFKARLPERVYRKFVLKEALPIENKHEFQIYRLRAYYARHGNDSKLNPGICWPTRKEISETIEDDKIFEPPLQEKIKKIEEARLADEKIKRDYEEEVDKNMANLDKWVSDYEAKKERKNAEVLQLRLKKEKLVEEISEYLGYDIDPRDPRFEEAVQQREKERKKAMKAKKQQESYDKMISKLKQMAEKSN